jgi:hypothetical protein
MKIVTYSIGMAGNMTAIQAILAERFGPAAL